MPEDLLIEAHVDLEKFHNVFGLSVKLTLKLDLRLVHPYCQRFYLFLSLIYPPIKGIQLPLRILRQLSHLTPHLSNLQQHPFLPLLNPFPNTLLHSLHVLFRLMGQITQPLLQHRVLLHLLSLHLLHKTFNGGDFFDQNVIHLMA